jgi:hypothetical protein
MWQVNVRPNLVVCGCQPEFACVENPEGAVYAEEFLVVAEDRRGKRFAHPETHRTIEGAKEAVEQAKFAIFRCGLNPRWYWNLLKNL